QGDPHQSLAALASGRAAAGALGTVPDPDVQASLAGFLGASPTPGPATPFGPAGPEYTTDYSCSSVQRRYQVLRPLAPGGLGEGSAAAAQRLHGEVALKEIPARHADDPHNRGRFLLEAQITGGLEHPGIVPVYGRGTYRDGRPFYAMRL